MFTSNTPENKKEMLSAVGVKSMEELLGQIPQNLLYPALRLSSALTEQELTAHINELGAQNKILKNYIGAGMYEHFVPAAVNALSSRGEFLTAYTPYQAEASQGTLQTIYEFQSCICSLFDMDVATASHYDGATALAEAVLACVRVNGKRRVLVSSGLHPHYKQVLCTYLRHFPDVSVEEAALNAQGTLDLPALKAALTDQTSCFVLPTPNFLGNLEEAEEISSLVHQAGALLVAAVNPVALGIMQTPGSYGADFAVAEGQPLGNKINFGGPGLGLMTAKKAYVRQLPGRIVGVAKDKTGKRAFVLTLQAREQHIRRERAASNICSNEALCALNAVIYLTLLGPEGLKEVAQLNLARAHKLAELASAVPGFKLKYTAPFFNEFVLSCPVPAETVIHKLEAGGISAGYALKGVCGCGANDLLVCATETKTEADLEAFAAALGGI